MYLRDQLKILFECKNGKYLKLKTIKDGFEFDFGAKNERRAPKPHINFSFLAQISGLFGTKEVDVDNYQYAGCETCDYLWSTGSTIQVYNVTKNVAALKQLVGIIYE